MLKHKSKLERMYKQVKNLDEGLLLAGLTVLVKDTANYLHEKAYSDPMVEEFRQEYLKMLNQDRYYWEHFGKDLYKTLPEAGLPHGIVAEAAKCKADLSDLCDAKIERESTRAPAWSFFESYTRLLQEVILAPLPDEEPSENDERTPLQKHKDHLDTAGDEFEVVELYVERLTNRSELGEPLWSPVMLYIALLIVRTHFVTFPEA